jgi:peptidoglycan/xylan/chitin deacetylase (PgdA/CDA1 family)
MIAASETNAVAKPQAPAIVLKLDDMFVQDGRVPDRWRRIADFSAARKIKVSIGIICNSLEGDHPEYIAELKRQAATGLVEFWHHGYDHRQWHEGEVLLHEFAQTSLAHQKDHFERAQKLAKDKLGITFTTFGAPFNAVDDATVEVLADAPDIRVWLYGNVKADGGKFIAHRVKAVNLETPVHKPNYDALVKGFEAERANNHRYLVMQGHPVSWDDAAFAEFVRIVDYLAAEGCAFIFPSELPSLAE